MLGEGVGIADYHPILSIIEMACLNPEARFENANLGSRMDP